MKKLSDENQIKQIADFYRELWSYTGLVPWLVPALLMLPSIVIFCIPVAMEENHIMLIMGPYLMANLPMAVLLPYLETRYAAQPKVKKQKIYQILQYLPVSRKQIRRFLLEQLWKYIWKISLAAALGQTFFSCLTDTFQVSSILLVVFVTLALPMAMGILMIWNGTKEKK